MVVVQDDVPLEAESSVVGYNLNATMMASAHAGSVDIYARTPSDPLWTPTARTETLIRSHITAGEEVVALSWAHPQYGSVLAAGTSYGRVLLMAAESGKASWQVLQVLLDEPTRRRSPVTSLHFSPPTAGLVLGVASADGCARLLKCSVQHPLLPDAQWVCAHTLRPSASAASQPCTCLSWQPQADPADVCLVLSSESAASLWLYNPDTMDWECTCADLEAAAGCSALTGQVACCAWAPLVGRSKETIAVARGSAVRILGLHGSLLKPTVEQIGDKLLASGPVWKLEWNCFGFEIAVSCEEDGTGPATVSLWRMSIEGVFGPKPVALIQGPGGENEMEV